MSIVLITGCSTGIGFATAISLAQAEHKVFAAMRNPSSSPELAARAADNHLPIRVLRMDVDSDESVREAVQEVLSAHERIDVLAKSWKPTFSALFVACKPFYLECANKTRVI